MERAALRDVSISPALTRPPNQVIRALFSLTIFVNLAWSLYQLPLNRVIERRLCREYYAVHDPTMLEPGGGGGVSEELCKIDAVQQGLGRIQGVMETTWVVGDFVMTIPLVALVDLYGCRLVLWLNLVPRLAVLAWTLLVGYLEDVLPTRAIMLSPALSILGGDCVFNSIVYSLVANLTDDYILRATYFAQLNAFTMIFSLQLGPALAAFSMDVFFWLPFWIGILLLLLAIPAISVLPSATPTASFSSPFSTCSNNDEQTGSAGSSSSYSRTPPPSSPLLKAQQRRFRDSLLAGKGLHALVRSRVRSMLAILTSHPRNFALLLACFLLSSLASSDTKLLTQYVSKRFGWRFASVGYLLSVKAVFGFVWLTVVVPRVIRWRAARLGPKRGPNIPVPLSSCPFPQHRPDDQGSDGALAVDDAAETRRLLPEATTPPFPSSPALSLAQAEEIRQTIQHGLACLAFSVLGALAIALAPTIWLLVPALLTYVLGATLSTFTYSLLKSPAVAPRKMDGHRDTTRADGSEREADHVGAYPGSEHSDGGYETQMFSLVMLVRTVGLLIGAPLMAMAWVWGIGLGGAGLGMPFFVSAGVYALTTAVFSGIRI